MQRRRHLLHVSSIENIAIADWLGFVRRMIVGDVQLRFNTWQLGHWAGARERGVQSITAAPLNFLQQLCPQSRGSVEGRVHWVPSRQALCINISKP